MKFKKAPIVLMMRGTKDKPAYLDVQDGYTFEYMFSNGHLHTLGVYKNLAKDALHKTRWIVTDLGTGYAICDGRSREEAVKKVFDVYGSKLERMVFSNVHYPHRDSITNQYEYMCDEFRKMRELGAGAANERDSIFYPRARVRDLCFRIRLYRLRCCDAQPANRRVA